MGCQERPGSRGNDGQLPEQVNQAACKTQHGVGARVRCCTCIGKVKPLFGSHGSHTAPTPRAHLQLAAAAMRERGQRRRTAGSAALTTARAKNSRAAWAAPSASPTACRRARMPRRSRSRHCARRECELVRDGTTRCVPCCAATFGATRP